MKGLHLRSLKETLHQVPQKYVDSPVRAIVDIENKLLPALPYIRNRLTDFSFYRDYYKLPLSALCAFSFDEICKMQYSSIIMMHQSVWKLFKQHANHGVVFKIRNSIWRWGGREGTWNEIVDAYECLQHFSLNLDANFQIRLDYTTGCNEYGMTQFSRTYCDGVFAFLVYHKNIHVMTIGFSFVEGRRILIQQVQLKNRTGNRWLYALPRNRVEFVLTLFMEKFPGFELYVIDGEALATKIVTQYTEQLHIAQTALKQTLLNMSHSNDVNTQLRYMRYVDEDRLEIIQLEACIAHIQSDMSRLIDLYADTGTYTQGPVLSVNSIPHHQVLLS